MFKLYMLCKLCKLCIAKVLTPVTCDIVLHLPEVNSIARFMPCPLHRPRPAMPALAKNNRLANAALAALAGHIIPRKMPVAKPLGKATPKGAVKRAAAKQADQKAEEAFSGSGEEELFGASSSESEYEGMDTEPNPVIFHSSYKYLIEEDLSSSIFLVLV